MKDQPQPGHVIDFGPFRFDTALGKLSKHGTAIRLRGMPLKILHHLVERPGEVVSRRELQSLLWTGTAFGDFEQGLNSAVNVVRKTLSDSADQARYLETVPGQGYRFIAPIRFAVVTPEMQTSNGALDSVSQVPPEIRDAPMERKLTGPGSRWWIAAAFALAALGCGAWWTFHSKPRGLIDGSMPSANQEANDQYNLAFNFLAFQSDIPLARKTFEHALELDPDFAAARLQRALMTIIDIYNGYANDGSILVRAEEDLHQAEKTLPASDGLLLAAQAGVYLAQGRLDRIPVEKMNDWWRSKGGNEGSPVWVVIPRMLEGKTEEPLAILRAHLERNPMEGPARMLLGDILRTQGNTAGAIQELHVAACMGDSARLGGQTQGSSAGHG